MTHIKSKDAAIFNVPGVTFTGLASPSRGSTEIAAWRLKMEPGTPARVHRLTREEVFIATAGMALATIGDKTHELAVGDALIVPANVDFALENPGRLHFEAIAVLPVGGQAVIGTEPALTPPWAA